MKRVRQIQLLFAFTITIALLFSLTGCEATEPASQNPTVPGRLSNETRDLVSTNTSTPIDQNFAQSLSEFSYGSACEVLNGTDNECYSPLGLYVALSILREGAVGSTKEEIEQVLHNSDAFNATEECALLLHSLNSNSNDGIAIANSLWMVDSQEYEPSFIELADTSYYADLHLVDFGNSEALEQIRNWSSENTNGAIEPELTLTNEDAFVIINTLRFDNQWVLPFSEGSIKPDIFYASGEDIETEFMTNRYDALPVIQNENYTRVSLLLGGGATMTFLLPGEETSVDELLSDPAALSNAFLEEADDHAVFLWLPKFTYDTTFELIPAFNRMGMMSAFCDTADFSGITTSTGDPLFVSQIMQCSRIVLDEEGVKASAVSIEVMYPLSAPNDEEPTEIRLDRPFIYEIKGQDGTILFLGVCANPTIS